MRVISLPVPVAGTGVDFDIARRSGRWFAQKLKLAVIHIRRPTSELGTKLFERWREDRVPVVCKDPIKPVDFNRPVFTGLRFCSIGLNLETRASVSARHSMRLSPDPRRVPASLNWSRGRASVRLDLIPTRRQKIYSPMNHRCLSRGWLVVGAVQIQTLAAARSQAILSCPESVRGKPCSFRRLVRCRLGRLARCL